MTIYDEMQQLASDLLKDFDQPTISHIRMTQNGTGFDPGPATATPTVLDGAVARGVMRKYVDKSLVVATDLQVTYAGDKIEPLMTDFIDINGEQFKIQQIVRKPASGPVVAWTVIVRKGK